jgi:hypothetical protein
MKKGLLFLLSLLSFISVSNAQTIALDDSPKDFSQSKYGANRRHFVMFFVQLGKQLNDAETTAGFQYANSNSNALGASYKLKLAKHIHWINDVYWNPYKLRYNALATQNGTHELLSDLRVFGLQNIERYRIRQQNFGVNTAMRIKFGKGNSIGFYFDLGAFAMLTAQNQLQIRGDLQNIENVRINYNQLQSNEALLYGLHARFGFEHLSLFAKYRLNEAFNGFYMPKTEIGLHIYIY